MRLARTTMRQVITASMKALPKRKGNLSPAADMMNPLYTVCLNESPPEKEGKY